jgi:hypothetical protein
VGRTLTSRDTSLADAPVRGPDVVRSERSEFRRRGADSDWNGASRAEATIRLITGNIGGRVERIGTDRRFAQA